MNFFFCFIIFSIYFVQIILGDQNHTEHEHHNHTTPLEVINPCENFKEENDTSCKDVDVGKKYAIIGNCTSFFVCYAASSIEIARSQNTNCKADEIFDWETRECIQVKDTSKCPQVECTNQTGKGTRDSRVLSEPVPDKSSVTNSTGASGRITDDTKTGKSVDAKQADDNQKSQKQTDAASSGTCSKEIELLIMGFAVFVVQRLPASMA